MPYTRFDYSSINSGSLRKVTQSQTDHAVACTSDGRYVFFTDTSAHGNLSVVDVDSRIQRMIYSNNKFNHWIIEDAPISPSGRHVIGPVTLNSEIELSDRRLRGLTLPSLLSDEYISGIAWAHDDQLYLLFGSEILRKLMILDIKNNMASVINLPQIKGYIFGRIRWAEQGQLFLQTVADAELAPRLYTIDIKNPKESLKIIGDGIDDFSVLPDGSVVYTQATGVNYQMDRSVIEPETAYQILAKRNPQGSIETLISLPYLSSGMLGIQASQSSQAIAFTQQPTPGDFNRSVINVLYLNK